MTTECNKTLFFTKSIKHSKKLNSIFTGVTNVKPNMEASFKDSVDDDDDDDDDEDDDDNDNDDNVGPVSYLLPMANSNNLNNEEELDEEADEPDYMPTNTITPSSSVNRMPQGCRLLVSYTHDGRFECDACHLVFDSLLESEQHECLKPPAVEKPEPLGRRKRKSAPSKAGSDDPQSTAPKKKGRPRKYVRGDSNSKGGTKGTGRPKGRPKGSTSSAAKIRRRSLKVRTPRTLHECEICSKAFVNESKLKVHMFTHSGERPFRYVLNQ